MTDYNRIEVIAEDFEEIVTDPETGEKKTVTSQRIKEIVIPLTSDEIAALLAEKEVIRQKQAELDRAESTKQAAIEDAKTTVEANLITVDTLNEQSIKDPNVLLGVIQSLTARLNYLEKLNGIDHSTGAGVGKG